MSQHPSLKAKTSNVKQSVLKRFEKLKYLIEKGLFQEGQSILHLPKVKVVKFKVKKEKAAVGEEGAAATGQAAPAATDKAKEPQAKTQAKPEAKKPEAKEKK